MNKYLYLVVVVLSYLINTSCNNSPTEKAAPLSNESAGRIQKDSEKTIAAVPIKNDSLNHYVPKGFVIFETIYGDFNRDRLEDCILIIKNTDKKNYFKDESRGWLDRNRRGVIALLKKKNHYKPILKNLACFSSENEDGGVYYPPDLSIEINKGILYIHYSHGRYGYWKYTFRYEDSDFALIGYDLSSNHGPVILHEVSINYLTRKKIVRDNTNENGESGEEVFEETVTTVKQKPLLKLSHIIDFDELSASGD